MIEEIKKDILKYRGTIKIGGMYGFESGKDFSCMKILEILDKYNNQPDYSDENSDKIDKKSLLSYLDYGCGSYFELGSQHEEFLKNIKEYLGVDIDE